MENKIFCKMKAFLVVLAVLCAYPCSGELESLAPSLLKKINIKTSIDILNQIVETITATVKEQNTLTLACESDINKTVASCEACAADLCQQKQLGNVGKGFVNAGRSIGDAFKSIFGKRSTRHILHKQCVKSCAVCGTIDAFKRLFGKRSTRHILHKRCVKSCAVCKTIDAGKSIGDAFKSLFGKRSTRHIFHKRCVKSCPVCETLNTKKHPQEKTVEEVCGQTFVSKQKKAQDTLKDLEEVYDYILKENPVVTKFEIDTTSIDFDNGSIIFKKSFVTFQAGKIGKRFKFPWRFNSDDIDAMAVKISKEVREHIMF